MLRQSEGERKVSFWLVHWAGVEVILYMPDDLRVPVRQSDLIEKREGIAHGAASVDLPARMLASQPVNLQRSALTPEKTLEPEPAQTAMVEMV